LEVDVEALEEKKNWDVFGALASDSRFGIGCKEEVVGAGNRSGAPRGKNSPQQVHEPSRKRRTDGRKGPAGRRPFRREIAKLLKREGPRAPGIRGGNSFGFERVKGLSGKGEDSRICFGGGRAWEVRKAQESQGPVLD
jgi:hypothetical protein